jgi:hypothetical protein
MELVEFILNEEVEDKGVFAISLVEQPAIEENFVYFSKQEQKFATVDNDKRIVLGAVMIPDIPIARVDENGDKYNCFFSKETIERVVELYMVNSKHQSTTLGHERTINGITTVESWIVADSDKDKSNAYGFSYPVGTWVACMKIDNEEIWQQYIKEGKVKGFSIEGYFEQRETQTKEEATLSMIREIILNDEIKTVKK